MPLASRKLFPWVAAGSLFASLAWALNKSQVPPADFTFVNGTEVKSLDPAIVTGQPENRMINALFEGLVTWHPKTLEPTPGVAERWEISDDKRVYTFHLRDNAQWSDGAPITAEDFYYSMRRFLDPRTEAEYAYQAWYIKNGRRYTGGGTAVRAGDPVELELNLPPDALNTVRGEMLHGKLVRVENDAGSTLSGEALDAAVASEDFNIESLTYVVEFDGREQRFRYADDVAAARDPPGGVRWCRQVLLDFREVGVELVDRSTIRFTLTNPTPYFLNLLGFYPLFPVQRACVERYGSPAWTDVDKIVCNGPFKPQFRHLRDRTRVVKNERYWNRDAVRLNSVDFLACESVTTGLNLYLTGKVDWIYDVPPSALKELLREDPPRDDVNPQPLLNTYFYYLNTTRKPLDDVRVRRALSMAMDRTELTTRLLVAGEQPAYSFVPPVLPGYDPPRCEPENVEKARALLAEAGYPDGRGFPELEILYNTHEVHSAIAQLIRKQWQRNLGIRVRTRNEEFATMLNSQRALNYDVSRLGWIADYPDRNTYLDMFVTGGQNNRTGFSNATYDLLIAEAAREPDPVRRFEMLSQCERILMDEMPLLPFYFYVGRNMVKPYVRGFYNNYQDTHPVWALWIDGEQKTPNEFLEGRR